MNVHSAREYNIEIEGLKKQIEDRNDECSELGKRMNDFRSSMNEQFVKASERVKERENVLLQKQMEIEGLKEQISELKT